MHFNNFLFLLCIPEQDQEISPCSRSGLCLPDRGHVLVRCSHTITGLRAPFMQSQFLDLLWNSLFLFTLSSWKCLPGHIFLGMSSRPNLPGSVFMAISSLKCLPSHIFLVVSSWPYLPSSVSLATSSLKCLLGGISC